MNPNGDTARRRYLARWGLLFLRDLAVEMKMAPQSVERLLRHHGELIQSKRGWRLIEPGVADRFRQRYGVLAGAITATELARRAGVDRRTVASACRSGRIATIKVPGRSTFLISEPDAQTYVAKHGRLQEATV